MDETIVRDPMAEITAYRTRLYLDQLTRGYSPDRCDIHPAGDGPHAILLVLTDELKDVPLRRTRVRWPDDTQGVVAGEPWVDYKGAVFVPVSWEGNTPDMESVTNLTPIPDEPETVEIGGKRYTIREDEAISVLLGRLAKPGSLVLEPVEDEG